MPVVSLAIEGYLMTTSETKAPDTILGAIKQEAHPVFYEPIHYQADTFKRVGIPTDAKDVMCAQSGNIGNSYDILKN